MKQSFDPGPYYQMSQDQMMNKVLVTIKTQEKNGSERERWPQNTTQTG